MKQQYTLYKIDSTGSTRVWQIRREADCLITTSGVDGGKMVTTKPKRYKGVNIGRSNELTGEEVAQNAMEKHVKDKIELRGYSENISGATKKIDRFEVTLADRYDKRKDKVEFPVIASPKLDGFRCYITKDGMFTRHHKSIPAAPHIFNAVKFVFEMPGYENCVLDGELYNHDLKDNFEEIISLGRKTKPTLIDIRESEKYIQFHIFDIDTKHNESYISRFAVLKNLFSGSTGLKSGVIRLIQNVKLNSHDEVETFLADCLEHGYEGCMLRLGNVPYIHKRTPHLLKVKTFKDGEFEIVDITEGVGNRSGMAGRVICKDKNGQTFEAGLRGNIEYFEKLLKNKKNYIGKKATIIYQGLTNAKSVPRFGVMKVIRDYE